MNDSLKDQADRALDEQKTRYLKKLLDEEARKQLYSRPAVCTGYGANGIQIQELGQNPVAKTMATNGAIGVGDAVIVKGQTVLAMPHVKRTPKKTVPGREIDLEITFESININSQPFRFIANGIVHEIAYDLAQRFDIFGRGLMTLPMRTRDRKLKMTLQAENTGNLDTSVNAFFYPARVRNLDVAITCETQVENWHSNNPQPDSRFVNWLILDDFKLPTQDFFSFLDTATLAYPPYPSSASGFVNDGVFGTIDAEKIVGKLNGTISQGGQNSGASIFIFAPFTAISTLSDVDAFTYTTTYTFTFK